MADQTSLMPTKSFSHSTNQKKASELDSYIVAQIINSFSQSTKQKKASKAYDLPAAEAVQREAPGQEEEVDEEIVEIDEPAVERVEAESDLTEEGDYEAEADLSAVEETDEQVWIILYKYKLNFFTSYCPNNALNSVCNRWRCQDFPTPLCPGVFREKKDYMSLL